jgi:hypothetical protein
MSILTVVREVCAAIGVNPPTSLFSPVVQPRTQLELLALANEMAQRIAYDVREWRALKAIHTITGDGVLDRFPLPANFKRMLLTSQVYPASAPRQTLQFVPDADEWLTRRLSQLSFSWGEWTIIGQDMLFWPILAAGAQVSFVYLDKNCIELNAGGFGSEFMNDADKFRIDERILRLGMIWQWKANKGSPYAEDMGTYSDALVNVAGADQPAPIIIGDGRWQRYDAGYVQPPR